MRKDIMKISGMMQESENFYWRFILAKSNTRLGKIAGNCFPVGLIKSKTRLVAAGFVERRGVEPLTFRLPV